MKIRVFRNIPSMRWRIQRYENKATWFHMGRYSVRVGR